MEEMYSSPEKGECIVESLSKEVNDMYLFRDMFFENHPIEMADKKQELLEEKMKLIEQKFNNIDENEIPADLRAQFLYLKGRAYNIGNKYNPKATQCLSKTVKLNPRLADAWNELGESYWKDNNVKEAKNCFEGALLYGRDRTALRSLSIMLRQAGTVTSTGAGTGTGTGAGTGAGTGTGTGTGAGRRAAVERSVALAKEAVGRDSRDGASWLVLGNALLCQYFDVAQEPATLRASLGAYRQAKLDPVARGQPDLYYNCGVALKYDEKYQEALEDFTRACQLDPLWDVPAAERTRLLDYLSKVTELIRTKGKIKTKKLAQMIESLSSVPEPPGCQRQSLSALLVGENGAAAAVGKVVGSVYSESVVPFTFALTDASGACAAVSVYNWAPGRGVLVGDTVCVPRPRLAEHRVDDGDKVYAFKSIRVSSPLHLTVNGRGVTRAQYAAARACSTYEIH